MSREIQDPTSTGAPRPSGPAAPGAEASGTRDRPIALLRETLRAATDEAELERLARALARDPRAGARALARSARTRIEASRCERDRIAGLLVLRDTLVARGVRGVAGVDEVGVGPLAGPVVAAAVVLPDRVDLPGLDDSKRVRPALRERLARAIRDVAIGVGLGEAGVEEIDQLGIQRASLEAMRRAIASLVRTTRVEHLLIDARTVPGVDLPQTPIVKGDAKDASIAAASIVAKVHRDGTMRTLARRYPAYGFERHMGYGTAAHLAALRANGPSPVHRRSFAPVAHAERGAWPTAPGPAR